MARNRILAGVIVVATIGFAIGVSIEKSETHSESGETAAQLEAEGAESTEAEESEEAHAGEAGVTESEGESEESEELLGINLESTPLVVLAIIGSLVLAAAAWLRPDLGWLLSLVAVAMLAFAVLDVREVFAKLDEDESGLAALAGLVAALHLVAAGIAGRMIGGARASAAEAR